MIDPLTGAALNEALAGITAEMAGASAADAYNNRMSDTYTDASGVVIGYGNYTDDKPAISGNTENTIDDSSESDPEQAWLDWMHDGGSVDAITGGAVIGSNVSTFNYDIGQNSDDSLTALQPVAVPVDMAYVALSQALGVSMDISEIDPVLGNKFSTALVAAGVVYNGARNLVTAWWDGVNLLFPRLALEAIQDVIDEEGIGGDPSATSDIISGTYPIFGTIMAESFWCNNLGYTAVVGQMPTDGYVMIVYKASNSQINVLLAGSDNGIKYRTVNAYRSGSSMATSISDPRTPQYNQIRSYTHDNKTVYWWSNPMNNSNGSIWQINYGVDNYPPLSTGDNAEKLAWSAVYGTVVPGGFPEGTEESEATKYTPETIPPGPSVLGKSVEAGVHKAVETIKARIPDDPYNTKGNTDDPTTGTTTKEKDDLPAPPLDTPIPRTEPSNPAVPLVDSSVVNAELINELVEDLATTLDPQAPQSTGMIPIPPFMPGTPNDPADPSAGSQFPTIVPSSGSGFIHVYNPTPAEFVAFGNWLWVTYADATIDKIWNNPFDGVLGAHELYATPGVSGRDNIRSGFLVCPTSANLVPNRYTEIDCGTVVVPEFYGNYLDYSPYSQCYIYLPFIGINEVSIDDIVGHAVNIRYRVDSYSGACIAMIYVAKQGYRNLCYQFAGNCSVEVPLAGGSQAAIKAGMMQAEAYGRAAIQSAQIQKTAKIGTGIVQGAHAGAGAGAFNPVAGIVGGLLGGLAGGASGYIQGAADYGAAKLSAGAMQDAARVANKSSVQHSGQFGASHGAMGLKVPFIMVRNPIQVKVTNYNNDYGFPAHKRVIIGGCTGYLRVKEVNVISAHATNEEKIAIEEALKNGVYVS